MSLPSIAVGIDFDWIGVGTEKPMRSSAARSPGAMPRPSKPFELFSGDIFYGLTAVGADMFDKAKEGGLVAATAAGSAFVGASGVAKQPAASML